MSPASQQTWCKQCTMQNIYEWLEIVLEENALNTFVCLNDPHNVFLNVNRNFGYKKTPQGTSPLTPLITYCNVLAVFVYSTAKTICKGNNIFLLVWLVRNKVYFSFCKILHTKIFLQSFSWLKTSKRMTNSQRQHTGPVLWQGYTINLR